jgi:hypothetical protein
VGRGVPVGNQFQHHRGPAAGGDWDALRCDLGTDNDRLSSSRACTEQPQWYGVDRTHRPHEGAPVLSNRSNADADGDTYCDTHGHWRTDAYSNPDAHAYCDADADAYGDDDAHAHLDTYGTNADTDAHADLDRAADSYTHGKQDADADAYGDSDSNPATTRSERGALPAILRRGQQTGSGYDPARCFKLDR